jgi:hypothetical protein
MNLQKRLNELYDEVITALCRINEIPDGLLPHCVYVEEETEQSLDCGNSVYTAYNLIKIFRDGFCILENPVTGKEEKRQLREINIEWLICVWDYYRDLSGVKEPEAAKKKELYAFLYPLKHFERNASNHEILSGWMDGAVEKLTLDELAARINDESFDDANLWVRFMEVED